MAIDPDVQVVFDAFEQTANADRQRIASLEQLINTLAERVATLEAQLTSTALPKEIAVVMPDDATTRYIQEPTT